MGAVPVHYNACLNISYRIAGVVGIGSCDVILIKIHEVEFSKRIIIDGMYPEIPY